MGSPPSADVLLLESRVLAAPSGGLRPAWARVREIVHAHPALFDRCDVVLHRAGDRARFEALAAHFPALQLHRGDLVGSFADFDIADEIAALRPGWRLVTLRARLRTESREAVSSSLVAGLVASRVVDETRLVLSVPRDARADDAPLASELAPLVEHVGPAAWCRYEHAPRAATKRAELRALASDIAARVTLSFDDDASSARSPRDMVQGFRRALATLGFVAARGSEARHAVLKRATPAGNLLAVTLDLAGIAPGPWSAAVDLALTGLSGELRLPIARAARVTSEAAWSTRLSRVVSTVGSLGGDIARADALLGPAPAWLVELESTLCASR